jgi:ABC-2 type transport system ATP-binding protein
MSAIEINNLTKKFKDFTAVSKLSFEVAENRVMGFLGPNGAGKTTTLRILVGLSKATSGIVKIAGKEVTFGDSSTNYLIGYLPEQPSFYNWMTGEEYLSFIGDTFALSKDEKKTKIDELLKKVNLLDARKKRIGAYSNGMKQRLGIAQALMNNPKVLIMDEPVSSLDPIGRRDVLNIVEDLKKEMTILISTHILSDVDKICDDVAIINKGELVIVSPLSDLKEKYATSILEVEFDKDPERIVSELKKQSWVKEIEKNGNLLKIWLNDDKAMQANLPLKFFGASDIGVLKYGLNLPEVEDLFVDLIGEQK